MQSKYSLIRHNNTHNFWQCYSLIVIDKVKIPDQGSCSVTEVFNNNTIHLPSEGGRGMAAGLHFVLPVADGQSPQTICAWHFLPTGVGDLP